MKFLETRVFTAAIAELMSDDDYAALQATLISRPHLGVLIQGGGGIRKVRWGVRNRGKRGGARV
jgi:hypothetical protein